MEHDRDLQHFSRPEASWIAESRGPCSARFRSSRSPLDSYAAIRTCSAYRVNVVYRMHQEAESKKGE